MRDAAVSLLTGRRQGAARDPLIFAGAAIVFVAAAVCAGWLPARTASRLNPVTMLRG